MSPSFRTRTRPAAPPGQARRRARPPALPWGRSARSRTALSVALLLGVLVLSAGTGYRSSRAILDNASTYLPSGHGVAHANGATGRTDAQLQGSLADGRERLATAQTSEDDLYVVNKDTGKVSSVDTSRMKADTVVEEARAGTTNEVVAGGRNAYVVTHERDEGRETGSVSLLDPHGSTAPSVKIDGEIVGRAVDANGTAWILLSNGRLHEVRGTELAGTVDVGRDSHLLLTLLHDRPVVVRADDREVVVVEPGGKQHVIGVDLRDGKPIVASAPSVTAGALWLIVQSERQIFLFRVDIDGGGVSDPVDLGTADDPRYGEPLEVRGRVYVPDQTHRRVLMIDAMTLRTLKTFSVPEGGSGPFDLKADGDHVWINDQYAGAATAIGPDGTDTTVDKGDSPGLLDGKPHPGGTPPATPPVQTPHSTEPPRRERPIPDPPDPSTPPTGATPTTGPSRGPAAPPRTPTPNPIPTVTVPDVIRKNQQAACAAIVAVRLECRPVAVGNNGPEPTGTVIGTDPPAGSTVQERYIVLVRYRDRIEVPDLAGLTAKQACATVSKLGLACLSDPQGLAADATALNVVTGQRPAPAQRAETGDQVTVTFPNKIAVPQLVGTPVAEACTRLGSLGIATCRQVDLGLAPAGQTARVVARQTPPAGAGTAPTEPVTLEYYGGTPVTVPDLTGKSPDQAQAALTGLGLTPVPVPDEATNQPNVVHSQDPVAGSPVAPGTQVRYVYEDAVPTPLYLHKRLGEQFYLLSTESNVPGYSNQRSLGNVFPATSPPPGGATPVYRYRCDNNACGPGTTYYFSMSNTASIAPAWVNDGIAFYAYAGANRPSGTQEIWSLYYPSGRSWVWAVSGSAEYNIYIGRGYTSYNFSLGWAWP